VDTADEGGFFGFLINTPQTNAGAGIAGGVANRVFVTQFVLPFRVVVRNIVFDVTTQEIGALAGVGLYNPAGERVVTSGAISTTGAEVKTVAITPVTIEPGVYFVAWTCDGTTAAGRFATGGTSFINIVNKNAVRVARAANASSAGVLPATLGALTGESHNTLMVYFEA
jgi:hypothetical protein